MIIKSFEINGKTDVCEAAVGEILHIKWDCEGCEKCMIYPYDWETAPSGKLDVCVYETMTVILRAGKRENTVQKEILVKVEGGEAVNGVTVSPAEPVTAGIGTTFKFDLEKTRFGYLDHGIGRVEGDSYTQELSSQYGVYRYDILSGGKEIKFMEKVVKAGRKDAPELQKLKYVVMKNGNKKQYELSWKVVNNDGKDVFIKRSDQEKTFKKSASGHESFTSDKEEIVKLSIRCDVGEKGKIEFLDIYPLEL